MKLCHEASIGLSILNPETGKLEDAMHVELLDETCGIILYDRVYHALAVEKRAAMRAGRGKAVRACWVLSNRLSVGGKLGKRPRLHFVDHATRTYHEDRVNGGQTLHLPAAETPSAEDVRAMNKDPEHPLWDALLPLLHPNLEGL